MSNQEHTPGPWVTIPGPQDTAIHATSIRHDIASVFGYAVASSGVKTMLGSRERDANARLMAAAPDLLTVAEGALGYLQALPPASRPDPQWFTPLVAAIAAARGVKP